MDRAAWWAMIHGVAKSQTWLKLLSTVLKGGVSKQLWTYFPNHYRVHKECRILNKHIHSEK